MSDTCVCCGAKIFDERMVCVDCENKTNEKYNNVNHPKHYTSGKFECIDIMRNIFGDEAVKDFCKCNIFKYTYRANLKNGEEDRKKAEWYTEYLMKMNKGE